MKAAAIPAACGLLAAGLLAVGVLPAARAQGPAEKYSATVIPTEGYAGATSRIVIQITAYTSEEEKKQLREAFKKEKQDEGVALLRKMSKGHITVEGQPGRKILAVFSRTTSEGGRRLIVITDHVLSQYERNEGVRAEDYPFTILHLPFDRLGKAQDGEAFPGARFKVTEDGFVDVATQTKATAKVINITRQD
jgi:hypothetical protein